MASRKHRRKGAKVPPKTKMHIERIIKKIPREEFKRAMRGPKEIRKDIPKKIVVGFETHTASFVEKKRKYFEKADVILVELYPEYVEVLKRIKKGDSEVIKRLAEGSKLPEFTEKYLTLLKKEIDKGKTVIGTEIRSSEIGEKRRRERKESGRLKSWMAEADTLKSREEARLHYILTNLERFKNKNVFIDAGSIHTPIYHNLKRALKREEKAGNIEIEREHLARGMYGDKRILQKYSPRSQAERMYRFKGIEKINAKRMQELERQTNAKHNAIERLTIDYMEKGMTMEQAFEKAEFELLRRQKRKGLEEQ